MKSFACTVAAAGILLALSSAGLQGLSVAADSGEYIQPAGIDEESEQKQEDSRKETEEKEKAEKEKREKARKEKQEQEFKKQDKRLAAFRHAESDDSEDSSDSGCLSSCCSPFFDIFWKFAGDLWAANNLSAVYPERPYASPEVNFVAFCEPGETNAAAARSGYLRISTGLRWAKDENRQEEWGFDASLRGHFWKFFGPELDTWSLWDRSDRYLLHAGIGMNLAVFQTDPLSCDAYCQYSLLEGRQSRRGVAVGAVFMSYPVKPLVLEAKIGWQMYKNITCLDFSASAGVIVRGVEFNIGFNSFSGQLARLTGVSGGIRGYF